MRRNFLWLDLMGRSPVLAGFLGMVPVPLQYGFQAFHGNILFSGREGQKVPYCTAA